MYYRIKPILRHHGSERAVYGLIVHRAALRGNDKPARQLIGKEQKGAGVRARFLTPILAAAQRFCRPLCGAKGEPRLWGCRVQYRRSPLPAVIQPGHRGRQAA